MVYQHSVDSDTNLKNFSTARQLERREIKNIPDYEDLLAWNKKKGITLGEAISTNKTKYDFLQLL